MHTSLSLYRYIYIYISAISLPVKRQTGIVEYRRDLRRPRTHAKTAQTKCPSWS